MPTKNVTFFHSNMLLDNSATFTSSRMKTYCQKRKVKRIFRGACIGCQEPGLLKKNIRMIKRLAALFQCLEITDVWCNLKQFDGLTLTDPDRHILGQIEAYTTGPDNTTNILSSVIFVTKIKTRTRIIGRRFQRTRTRIIVIQKTKTK